MFADPMFDPPTVAQPLGSPRPFFRILGPRIDAIESLIGTMPSQMARTGPTDAVAAADAKLL